MIPELDLSWYGLYLQGYNLDVDSMSGGTKITVTFNNIIDPNHLGTEADKFKALAEDLAVMSKVRSSYDPAVQDAYKQLLTILALTK